MKSIIFLPILTIAFLFFGCSYIQDSSENEGTLSINIEFADNPNAGIIPGKGVSSYNIETFDQVHCLIFRNVTEVWSEDLTFNGSKFTGTAATLEEGGEYSVYVECYESSIMTYTGNQSGITVNAGQNTDVSITLSEYSTGIDSTFALGTTGLTVEMIWIPPGIFLQGAYSGEQAAQSDEYPQHLVTLDYGFWLGKYEVLQEQWVAVAGYNNSNFIGSNRPIEAISWNDIRIDFLTKLNFQTTLGEWRLPSESEWEYACRAGTKTRFFWGEDYNYTMIDDHAVYLLNDPSGTADVGTKLPNAWGLFDMSGNVFEWCEDYWHDNYTGASANGDPWLSPISPSRVLRGGSWDYGALHCRSAARSNDFMTYSINYYGFRLVRNP